MTEYIDRDAALAFQNELEPVVCKSIMTDELFSATKDSDLIAFLQKIPAADVRPVVRGEWAPVRRKDGSIDFRCTACRKFSFHNGEFRKKYRFCPGCGADMRKERDDG